MAQSRVITDIETIGVPWESLTTPVQEYLIKQIKGKKKRDARIAEAQGNLALNALTCNVVAIGMLNPDSGQGRIHLVAPAYAGGGGLACELGEVIAYTDTQHAERDALAAFWKDLRQYRQIITFNGRGFDGPVLMIRSMANGIPIGRNLVPYRYSPEHHLDLLDQLAFYGATRSPSLDIWCRRLGIDSPKEQGSGKDVERLWRAGEYGKIVRYLAGDLVATGELLRRAEIANIVPGPRNSKS